MQYQYEEIINVVKKNGMRKDVREDAYRFLTKLYSAAEEEMSILRNIAYVLDNERGMSDAIYSAITQKNRELEALEELVKTVRREL